MRSRALREGSVGLLALVAIGLFAGLVLWIKDVQLGRRSYPVTVEFLDARGLQIGTPVRYRGVTVGKIVKVRPTTSAVEVELDISDTQLLIPSGATVEAQTSALLGEKFLDIIPQSPLVSDVSFKGPLDATCDKGKVICSGSRLQGSAVADMTDLIRSMNQIAQLLSNPKLMSDVEKTAANAASATAGVSKLTRDLSGLSKSVQGEIGGLSDTLISAQQAAENAGQAANTISRTTSQTAQDLSQTAGSLSTSLGGSAKTVAASVTQAADQASLLLSENRGAMKHTLDSIASTSNSLKGAVNELTPVLSQVRQGEFLGNLDKLTENIRVVSANLRVASNALNDPANLILLQQTLDSARVTFQNAQKITSDLDEVTGDPKFRGNLRRLINGLSSLVASTQLLNQQTMLANSLAPESRSPQSIGQLTQLSGRVNTASLGLVQDLAVLSAALEPEPLGPALPASDSVTLKKPTREVKANDKVSTDPKTVDPAPVPQGI
jgi:phospholipid/cholesterol/gamma-HCH transport system substrate-binding protein